MRLFLSSYRFGNYADALIELLGDDATVGVIMNAKDYKSDAERKRSVTDVLASFTELGLTAAELDLRNYFDSEGDLREKLVAYDMLWLAGGNSFVLRRALEASGADEIIRELTLANQIIYGGESAGAVMAAPSLRGVEFGDDPYIVPPGYAEEEIWDGLHLVPYQIVPHYESDWQGYERMIEVYEDEDIPYKTLNDSQAIIVQGDEEVLLP